jgi:DNA-directed RNA polymerase subunit RPC12/RpoP
MKEENEMTETTKFHCAGCGKNYSTEKQVTQCSAAHASKRQKENERIEEDQKIRARNK